MKGPSPRDAVLFSVPPLALLAYLVAASLSDYHESLQFDDWWSRGRHAEHFFQARLFLAMAYPRANALRQRFDLRSDDPGILRIRVPRDDWDDVHDDALTGWEQWVDATVVRGNDLRPVELRKRGDTSVHWTTPKRSFTIKTPRDRLLEGFRRAAVSAKDVLPSYVANRLAAEFDVLVPYTAITPVFLNDQFYGVFRFIENVDESFIRRVGRMPGNIFRADAAERGEYYKGLRRRIFMNPYIWDRRAENNVPGVRPDSALLELLAGVNGTTFADHLDLMGLVDRNELARVLAAMLLVGDPYHMSDVHNQFWYEDPTDGRLHPILWDLRLLDLERPSARVNAVLRSVLRDPFMPDLVMRVLHEQLERDSVVHKGDRIAREAYDRYRPYFEYDRLRRAVVPYVGSPDETAEVLSGNASALRAWLENSSVLFHAATGASGLLVDFRTGGYAGSDLRALSISGLEDAGSWRLFADRNRNGSLDAEDPEVPAVWEGSAMEWRLRLSEPLALLAGWRTDELGIRPGGVHYRLFLARPEERSGASSPGLERRKPGIDSVQLWPDVRNRHTGARSDIREWPVGAEFRRSTWHPWRFTEPAPSTLRMAGRVHISESLEIPEGGRLILEPGTDILLDPDVSIIVRGPVHALGTRERPITVRPATDGSPWGTFALVGPGASGSRFEHVRFVGGGGAVRGRVEYSGMVSVRFARDVRFSQSVFADNLRSDDALHAIHSEVLVRECEFLRANGDAIDFDISTGVIRECRFLDSGNDAIDLMTSHVRIIANEIEDSGDKGISVGERSDPLIFNNRIVGCDRGIEVKDGSRPVLLHNEIAGNGIGVLQQVKNWRYGRGGWATFVRNLIEDNDVDLESDDRSRQTRLGAWSAGSTEDESRKTAPHGGDLPAPANRSGVPDWVYAAHGIRTAAREPGRVARWADVASLSPLGVMEFPEDLEARAGGWRALGGTRRVTIRDHSLVGWVEGHGGTLTRSIAWDLGDGSSGYQLVLEIGDRDIDSLVLAARSAEGDVTLGVAPSGPGSDFRLVTLDLPPSHYSSVELVVRPLADLEHVDPATGMIERGSARIDLRELRLFARPAAGAMP